MLWLQMLHTSKHEECRFDYHNFMRYIQSKLTSATASTTTTNERHAVQKSKTTFMLHAFIASFCSGANRISKHTYSEWCSNIRAMSESNEKSATMTAISWWRNRRHQWKPYIYIPRVLCCQWHWLQWPCDNPNLLCLRSSKDSNNNGIRTGRKSGKKR